MKTNRLFFVFSALAIFASCSQEVEVPSHEKIVPVEFAADIVDFSTKTMVTTADESLFKTIWAEPDAIGVDFKNGNTESSVGYNLSGTYSLSDNKFSVGFPESAKDYVGNWEYRTYYPYSSTYNDNDGVVSIPFGPNREQTGNEINPAYDIMYGSASATNASAGKTNEGDVISFQMNRATALLYFHFTCTDNTEAIESATLTVTGDNGIAATSVAELTYCNIGEDEKDNGALIADDSKTITLTFKEAPSASDFMLWFNILPSTFETFSLNVKTATKEFTLNKETSSTYSANSIYKIALNASGQWIERTDNGGGDEPTVTSPEEYVFKSFTAAQSVSFEANQFAIDFKKNSGSTNPQWNDSAKEARVYAKGSVVVSSDYTISKIVYSYTVNANSKGAAPTIESVVGSTNTGAWDADTKTWTGNDTEVTLTTSGSAGNLGFTKITVYFATGSEGGDTPVVIVPDAPTLTPLAGTYYEIQTIKVANYNEDYLYVYTLDNSVPNCDDNLNVTSGNEYDHTAGISISKSCTLKILAVDVEGQKSSITSAEYTIIPTFADLESLVAADITSGTTVKVSFSAIQIKSIHLVGTYRNGVTFDIQKDDKDIEIYYNNVPTSWTVGGSLSGTITCPFKKYSGVWELSPNSGEWDWEKLTYTAPAEGTPTYKSVDELAQADIATGTSVKVVLENEPIFNFFQSGKYTNGIYFNTQKDGNNIVLYYKDVPEEWVECGLVSGTVSGVWTLYNGTWEIVPDSTWKWADLTYSNPTITLSSIAVSGTPKTLNYFAGDALLTDGLVVTGTFSDDSTREIKRGITWSVSPETLSAEQTECSVVATVRSVKSPAYAVTGLSVSGAKTVSFDLSTNSYSDASDSQVSWANEQVSMVAKKANASTATNNYLGGGSNNNTRFYKNSTLTFTPSTGITLGTITYTSTTENYAKAFANSTWTNATAAVSADNAKVVIVTPTDGTKAVSVTIGATTGANKIVFMYSE